MRFSVVIVTYNRLELLKECIGAVLKQKRKFDDIVIVNNCSTDGTDNFLKSYENSMNIITASSNIGGAGGFALGLENIKNTDYVLLIDDDAILDEYFLLNIEKHITPEVGAYSGTVYTDGNIDTTHRRRLKNTTFMTKVDVPETDYRSESFLYELSTFCGLIVSKDVISKIGLPIKDYFIWYDDTEYSLRINQFTKIKNINTAHINHKTELNFSNDLNWKSYYGYRNQIDCGRRHSKHPLIFVFYRYAYHFYRILYYAIKVINAPERIYMKNCSRLNKVVIRDSLRHKLGLNSEYFPGRNLKTN